VRQAVDGIEAFLAAKAQGVDVNAQAIDEFKKQQARTSDETGGGTPVTE